MFEMVGMKYLADFLTLSRLFIFALLVWLGWSTGIEGIQIAAIFIIYSWTSDMLDGYLARRSRTDLKTWIGDHDLYFDMLAAVGLLIYLTSAGFINVSMSIIYILIWVILFWWFGLLSALGKLFQAPVYAWFLYIVFLNAPIYGWAMVIFLLLAIVFTWPRFPQQTIPDFISGLERTDSPTLNEINNDPRGSTNSMDEDASKP